MSVGTRASRPDPVRAAQRRPRSQAVLVVVLTAVLTSADQLTKAWAWRHVPSTRINSGGNALTGDRVNAMLEGPVSGAALGVAGWLVLFGGGLLLTRVARPPVVLWLGGLAFAGWFSNFLDRLGLHLVTAPGSARGAVDFVTVGGHRWNLADAAILIGCLGFVPAWTVGALLARGGRRTDLRTVWWWRRGTPVVLLGALAVLTVLSVYSGVHSAGDFQPA